MKNLQEFENYVEVMKHPSKTIIQELIEETKASIKSAPKSERELLIELHDKINDLCILSPEDTGFRAVKSHMDRLVSNL